MASIFQIYKMLLVTFRTITQYRFTLPVENEDTMLEIKKKIVYRELKDEVAESMKLIYNGKVLEDTLTFREVNYAFDKFIVVMTSKKKQPPVHTLASTAAPIAQPATTTVVAPTSLPAPLATAQTTQSSISTAARVITTNAPAGSDLSAEQENTVEAIVAMGYPRDQVVQALRLAYFNADRAVEYLCTGFPDSSAVDDSYVSEEVVESGETRTNPLNFLNQDPNFARIREAVRSNPDSLPQLIQNIAENNPELLESIQSHQDDFIALLNTNLGSNDRNPRQEGGVTGGGNDGSGNLMGSFSITVTETERSAIERLKAMGFAEALVIEAYFSCDKNEDLAVNYILARMDEAEAEQEEALRGNPRGNN